MKEHNVDALVASYAANVNYLSGYYSLSQNLIRDTKCMLSLLPNIETPPVVVAPIGDLDCMADKGLRTMKAYGSFCLP